MKNKIRLMSMVALAGALGISSISYAQSVTPVVLDPEELQMVQMRRDKKQGMEKRLKEDLGLSDEQVGLLRKHHEAHKGNYKEGQKAFAAMREELRAELGKDKIDMQKIYALHEKIKAHEAKKEDQKLEGILAVRNILTAEQFKKFSEKFDERRSRGPGMRYGRPERPVEGGPDGIPPPPMEGEER